jgi:transcriptional regulator of arginine metabolism
MNTYSFAMQTEPAQLGKRERQRLIASLVTRKRLATQFELIDALEGAGCHVAQATVSRDVRELGLLKAPDALGRVRYVLPERHAPVAPRRTLESVLEQFGREAVAAQNVVVLHSELGAAPAIARALDRVEHPLVLGTLAGDDTVLVIARTSADAKALAVELGS